MYLCCLQCSDKLPSSAQKNPLHLWPSWTSSHKITELVWLAGSWGASHIKLVPCFRAWQKVLLNSFCVQSVAKNAVVIHIKCIYRKLQSCPSKYKSISTCLQSEFATKPCERYCRLLLVAIMNIINTWRSPVHFHSTKPATHTSHTHNVHDIS